MGAIVSDTTALMVLGKQNRLNLLEACFDHVLLPRAVYAEWLAGDAAMEEMVQDQGFLQVVALDDSDLLSELRGLLDAGEAEALVLSKQRGLPLLVDEKKGRQLAHRMGTPVLGVIGALLLAVQRGLLGPRAAKEILRQATDDGFRVSDRLVRSFLARLDS